MGDPNGRIDRGETVGLPFRIRNSGTSAAKGVELSAEITDAYVSLTNACGPCYSTVQHGDIAAGAVSSSNAMVGVQVDPGAPSGHRATMNVVMRDTHGNDWTSVQTLVVQ